MRADVVLAWTLFFLYALWATALQGVLASPRQLGPWTPDLGLVLLFSWAARVAPGRAPLAAILVALARASFGADPPLSLAAALLGALGLFAALRSMLEVDRPVARAALCGLGALLAGAILATSRSVALAASAPALPIGSLLLLPGASASALACLFLSPLCRSLPGLARLRRERP